MNNAYNEALLKIKTIKNEIENNVMYWDFKLGKLFHNDKCKDSEKYFFLKEKYDEEIQRMKKLENIINNNFSDEQKEDLKKCDFETFGKEHYLNEFT